MKGGAREGAGRPTKEGELRRQRQMRATDAEWNLIKRFEKFIKYQSFEVGLKAVEEIEKKQE